MLTRRSFTQGVVAACAALWPFRRATTQAIEPPLDPVEQALDTILTDIGVPPEQRGPLGHSVSVERTYKFKEVKLKVTTIVAMRDPVADDTVYSFTDPKHLLDQSWMYTYPHHLVAGARRIAGEILRLPEKARTSYMKEVRQCSGILHDLTMHELHRLQDQACG